MKIENASISWLASGLPYSTKFQDVYYSEEDELAESQHVFLQANNLSLRWASGKSADNFSIAELGFGSGLNFLQVAKLWNESAQRPLRLHYLGFEKYPLTKAQLIKIHQRWPTLHNQSRNFLTEYTEHSRGCHRLQLENNILLDLYFGDGFEQLNSRMLKSSPPIQCWFLDGFTPATNPQLWEEKFMQLLARCSNEHTTLSSYSVAGKVRAALANSGFAVQKQAGFGRKRHLLFAQNLKPEASQEEASKGKPLFDKKPWFNLPEAKTSGKTAAIIGAGLAGCSTAYSLAKRGWQIKIFEAGSSVAAAASGTAQLALRCRLFNAASSEAEFFLHSYLFALRQFAQLRNEYNTAWNDCGVLQLQQAMNKRSPLQQGKLQDLYAEHLVTLVSKERASELAGSPLSEAAWYFPSGGAMHGTSLCESYLQHSNIELSLNSPISELKRIDQTWSLQSGGSQAIDADIVILANSYAATQFEQTKNLPLQTRRGQTTEVAMSTASSRLRTVVSGERTVFPSVHGRHLLAASYSDDSKLQSNTNDNFDNLRIAATNFSTENFFSDSVVSDRVSIRCNSPDRLPIVGMMPDLEKMKLRYAGLVKNAKTLFQSPGDYLPGLYINVAHGSNGLASCPLSAEFLASMINNENLPLNHAAVDSLNPSRFLIRDLQKQKL